jgi:non-ribosomal peptide synthetase component F
VNISLLLEMTADAFGDRVAVGSGPDALTYAGLLTAARRAAALITEAGAERAGLVDESSAAQPVLLFGAALAGRVFAPVNYRLADDRLRALAARTAPALIVAGASDAPRLAGLDGVTVLPRERFWAGLDRYPAATGTPDLTGDEVAVWIFTSGTTGTPRRRCCSTGTCSPTSPRPGTSARPARTRPRWSACRRTTSPGSPRC